MSDTPVTPTHELEEPAMPDTTPDDIVDATIVDDELDEPTEADLERAILDEADELEGQAGAELEEDLTPAPLNPEPLPGFVRMTHPDLGDAVADVPEVAVNIHKARGWELIELPPEDTNPEASASTPEED